MSTPINVIVDLDVALTDFEVQIDSREFAIMRLDGPVEARINNKNTQSVPLGIGRWCASGESNIHRLYLSSPDPIPGGRVWIVIGHGGFSFVPSGESLAGGRHEIVPSVVGDGRIKPLLIDSEGRLFVRLADRLDETTDSVAVSGTVSTTPNGEVFERQVGTTASAVTAGVDTDGRANVSAVATAGVARDFTLEISNDGIVWTVLDTASAVTAYAFTGIIGHRHIRLRVESGTSTPIVIDISAK